MSRAEQIEAAARAVYSGPEGCVVSPPCGACAWCRLAAALALPADPVSVDERERALVEEAHGCGWAAKKGGLVDETTVDRIIRAVNVTHPHAPSVEYERGREDAARVCEAIAVGMRAEGERERAYIGNQYRPATDFDREVNARGEARIEVAAEIVRLAARIRAHAPVAQVAPSEVVALAQFRVEQWHGRDASGLPWPPDPDAPSAPRDQDGGLREWFSRVLRNAAERGLIVSQDETGIDAALAEVGPPPTDGVAAAYERLREACEFARYEFEKAGDRQSAGVMSNALAAPVSEKERAK